jgi:iron complex outermembrane receptor protein
MIIRRIFLITSIFILVTLKNTIAVTTVSKTAEDSFKSAAAAYVVNRLDIKRSGARNIAEVLRMVPGLQVAHSESGQWLVTSRGFANGFANKLLVMIDGKTIYTPLFSGVYWGRQDIMLENIKQIEVIRGPGAAQWGANAVNGVINIITEPAVNTQSQLATISYANNYNSITARHGGQVKNNSYYRVYASHLREENSESVTRTNLDNHLVFNRGGFRIDYDEFEKDLITIQGDIYNGNSDLHVLLPDLPVKNQIYNNFDLYGGNIMTKWNHKGSKNEDMQLQFYYDRAVRNYSLLSRRTQIFDIDFHYSKLFKRNEFITGFGYREAFVDFKGDDFRLNFNPTKRNTKLFSTFIQDKIALIEDKFYLTLGSKFEHNSFTGFEMQPSIKTSWLISQDQTFWTSISRATRTPNISENDINMVVNVDTQSSNYIRQQGNTSFDSEKLIAYEMGYRIRPTNNSLIDATIFYNDYDNLRSAERHISPENSKNFISVFPQNNGKGNSFGFELNTDVKVNKKWDLKAAYTYLKLDLDTNTGSTDTELQKEQHRSPTHQFNIQSSFKITNDITLNNSLYYVDSIIVHDVNYNNLKIPSYYRFDTGINWQYSNNISFDLVGQNLTDDSHLEFHGALWREPLQVGRTIYGKLTLKF